MKLEEALKTTKFTSEQHKASLNLMYTSYIMRDHFSKLMKECGITSEQFNVMRILKGKYPSPMCVKDIASRMIEKSSNVPRILDRLIAKDLVKRVASTEDKRESLIHLTQNGIEQLSAINQKVESYNYSSINLTIEEAVALNNLLEKMRENIPDIN